MSIKSFYKKQPRRLQLFIQISAVAGLGALFAALKDVYFSMDKPVLETEIKTVVTFDLSGIDDEKSKEIQVLLEAFSKQCRVEKYAPDIESIKARVEEPNTRTKEKEWSYQVYLEMKVSDDAQIIPNNLSVQGQTCNYMLGSNGTEAGMFLSDAPCQNICQTQSEYIILPILNNEVEIKTQVSSGSLEGRVKARKLIEELSKNISYISMLSGVESERVLNMLLFASKYLEEQREIKMGALEISAELYRSETIKELLITNKASLEEVLSQFVTYYEPTGS